MTLVRLLKKFSLGLGRALAWGALSGSLLMLISFFYDPWFRPYHHLEPFFSIYEKDFLVSLWFFFLPVFFVYGFPVFFLLYIVICLLSRYIFPIRLHFYTVLEKNPALQESFIFLKELSWSSLIAALCSFSTWGLCIACGFNKTLFNLMLPLLSLYTTSMIKLFHLKGSYIALGMESLGWIFAGTYLISFILTFLYRQVALQRTKREENHAHSLCHLQ